MKDIIITTHIGDEHWGAMEGSRLYKEEKEIYLKTLKKLPYIDIIFINGDRYDHDLSLNSKSTYYSLKNMEEVIKIAKKKGAKIRIIKGTHSHDHNQNDIFMNYDHDIDIKVINNVCAEYVKGINVLYLPEEYMKNYKEYYEDYFKGKYDIIAGHGMIEEIAFKKSENVTKIKTGPIFKSKELIDICYGPIIFGHIHDAPIIKNRIFYTGSFSRWKHGEEDPKGFIINLYDRKTKKFKIVPVINDLAREYITIKLDKDFIRNKNIEEIFSYIDNIYDYNNIYKLKIKIKDDKDDNYMSKIALIQSNYMYNTSSDITIEIQKNTNIIEDDDEEENERFSEQYNYLMNDSMTHEQKISRFLKDKGHNISEKEIDKFLNTDILTLLDELSRGGLE